MPRVKFRGGNNVAMAGTETEDKTFVFCPDSDLPFVVSETGITPPNPKFHITRKICDHYILIYVAGGRGTLDYEEETYELAREDVLLLVPGSRHEYAADPKDPFRLLWINFFCDNLGELLRGIGLERRPVVRGVPCEAQFLEIIRLAKETPNNNKLCFPVFRLVSDILLRMAELVRQKSSEGESRLAKEIKELLNASVYEKADIGAIAEKCFVSKPTVYREFKRQYGEPPYRYILNQKLELAKTMLLRSNETIASIAAQLAFSDEFYFSNLFKKKTGLSPAAFRKEYSK